MGQALETELPVDPTAARVARQLVADCFAAQLDPDDLDTARLLLSELVNNAVLHGRGKITLKAGLDTERLRVEVIDEGSGFERQVRETRFDDIGGRGLRIVDAESSRWGVYEGTTHVWFELERSGPRLGLE